MKKYIIIGVVAIVGAILAGYFVYQAKQMHYSLATVTRGNIVQHALANGNVQSPTTVTLSFENPGKLVTLNVNTGDNVTAGEVLAQQDSSVLQAQLRQAQADVSAANAKLQSLEIGATPQDIAVSETQVQTAGATLIAAIRNSYASADDAVHNETDPIFTNPRTDPQLVFSTGDPQLTINVQNERLALEGVLSTWQDSLPSLSVSGDLASAAASATTALTQEQSFLANAASAVNEASPSAPLSQTSIDSWKTSIASGRTEVNSALTAVSTDAATLAVYQKQLALKQAPPTADQVAAQEAAVADAQAAVEADQAQIAQTILTAPANGVVTVTSDTAIGENTTPSVTVMSIIPNGNLEINLNVSEDNIVGVKVGEPVVITLDAFPSTQTWTGKVVSIDPAQTIIGGAVYYGTTVLFDKIDPNVKPGMSATVSIRTGSATSALMVPASAIQGSGTSTYVELYQNGKVTNQNVTTGLTSQQGTVQVTSGLSEGEQVVTVTP